MAATAAMLNEVEVTGTVVQGRRRWVGEKG
jgi:hypothetical protein